MLQECLSVFQELYKKEGENYILDDYVLDDGTYVLIKQNDKLLEVLEINSKKEKNGKDNQYYKLICHLDYYSKLINMNKAIDIKKIIHSNNYLSFFIKKENISNGKLTEDIIDGYYERLANPMLKYGKDKNSTVLYERIEKQAGKPDLQRLEQCKKWIKDYIFKIEQLDDRIQCNTKDYLKVYFLFEGEENFRKDKELYEKEGKKYIFPNLYNKNDDNIEIDGVIYGVPNDNMSLNDKKPYLKHKTKKNEVPYMISMEEAWLQKQFFDYLYNCACKRETNIFIDIEKKIIKSYKNGESHLYNGFQGIFLKIKKAKQGAEIHYQDKLPFYRQALDKEVVVCEMIAHSEKAEHYKATYKKYRQRKELEGLLDQVYFDKSLVYHYFSSSDELNGIKTSELRNAIATSRTRLFNWFYKGEEQGVDLILKKIVWKRIQYSLKQQYYDKTIQQVNTWYSLENYFEGGEHMASKRSSYEQFLQESIIDKKGEGKSSFENDEQYYYGVGQVIRYLCNQSKKSSRTFSEINNFLNQKTNEALEGAVVRLFRKYSHALDIKLNTRFSKLYAMVLDYKAEEKVNTEIILLGYLSDNIIYYKEEK